MRKSFMGVRLKSLREQHRLTQAAFAQQLGLSPSYVNQLENNQRPLSVPVLLRLQSALNIDIQMFSEDEEARLISQLEDALAASPPEDPISHAEIEALVQQQPAFARHFIRLNLQARQAQERLVLTSNQLGERDTHSYFGTQQPHEEVRDFFYARHNYIAELDTLAEQYHQRISSAAGIPRENGASPQEALEQALRLWLLQQHQIRVIWLSDANADTDLQRHFDPLSRTLRLNNRLSPAQRIFQLAMQLAHIEAGNTINTLAQQASFSGSEAIALARIGLASYFAGAFSLPYAIFLQTAEAFQYDIDRLAHYFGVSFETVCHRLSTLQRPGLRGIPFFFVRVDRAGNISKRQSATDFHFSRTGGTCPRWNVYEAFLHPDKILTQLATLPDGRSYLWIARRITEPERCYGETGRCFAVGLGCDIRHAERLVYARSVALHDLSSATQIGPGCKVCERKGCSQRAFPALGHALRIDKNEHHHEPYASH